MRGTLAWAIVGAFVGAQACTQSTGGTCPPGSEGCPCTQGGECDGTLVCLSELCVDDHAETGDDDDDDGDDGDDSVSATGPDTASSSASATLMTSASDDDGEASTDATTEASEESTESSATTSADAEESSSDSGSGGIVVFDGSFLHDVDASDQCDAWNDFRADLVGKTFTRITMSGSEDPEGRTCEGDAADAICAAIFAGTPATIGCGTDGWSITDDCFGGLELDVSGYICDCGYRYTVRPCSSTNAWGGLNTDSCDTPSQTIRVECEYE